MPTLDRIVRDIHKGERPPRDLLAELAADENTAFLIDLAAALEAPAMVGADTDVLRRTFDDIERVLALTPSRACTEAALIIFQMQRTLTLPFIAGEQRQRRAAEWLASVQSSRTLLDVLSLHQDPATSIAGLIDPLAHEMIIRGIEHVVIGTHVERQHAAGHPLGVLTPTLTPLEKGISGRLPRHRLWATAFTGGWQPRGEGATPPLAIETRPRQATTDEQMARTQRAVEGVIMESNGDGLAHTFALEPPLPDEPGAAEALLAALDIGYTSGNGPTSAPEVFAGLFAAASQGGAYGGAQYGAYGRLRTWESAAGLAGIDTPASIDDIQQQALAARWFSFEAEWFHHVGWDVGVLCIHPGGRSCTVLAVTDTD